MTIKIGIIGGTGFYKLEALDNKVEVECATEFGSPSDKLVCGTIAGVDCVVLARHGRDHSRNPTEVNYRANLRALEKLGCTHVLAATACGSLRENMEPGDFVILDSFVDRTNKRPMTFHDQTSGPNFSTVAHIPMHPSFCEQTRQVLLTACSDLGLKAHNTGTMVTIEGPRFSSRAESNMFRLWGCDVINMTTVPEVVLAAEAGLSYVSVAMVTDFDCWKENEEAVSVEKVMAVIGKNADNVKKLFVRAVEMIGKADWTKVVEANKAKAKGARMN